MILRVFLISSKVLFARPLTVSITKDFFYTKALYSCTISEASGLVCKCSSVFRIRKVNVICKPYQTERGTRLVLTLIMAHHAYAWPW